MDSDQPHPNNDPRANLDSGSSLHDNPDVNVETAGPASNDNPRTQLDPHPALTNDYPGANMDLSSSAVPSTSSQGLTGASTVRCANCRVDMRRLRSHQLEIVEVRSIVQKWVLPQQVHISSNDFVCHSCWTAAWNEIRHPADSVSPSAARLICVGCGRSLRRQRSHLLSQDSPRENHIRENISRQIAPRQVAVPGKEEERWRSKDEGALFKRWRRTPSTVEAPTSTPAPTAPTPQPSELLKFLALNALELSAPASDALLKSRSSEWFQLAGHPGSLAPAGPGTVWKRRAAGDHPAHNPERDAYEALAACPHMRSAIPQYYRELEYGGERFIELQDLLHGFRDPHVMDVKMGTRTFLEDEVSNARARSDLYEKMVRLDPKAPTEAEHEARAVTKLRYMQFREQRSASAEQGFRIEAVKVPGQPPLTDLQKVREPQQIATTVARFLGNNEKARRAIITRLREIRELFENSDFFKTHEIVGSSIFIIYDDERVGAWLIDFAKTRSVPKGLQVNHRAEWQQGNHEEGFLYGLDRLIHTIETAKLPTPGDEAATEPDVSR